ncbi:helix-turn-helix domain-containing protein [Paenibacillus sp. FSL R7-0345]|uniref:helix-turn-helix domain-containing protein n=1 Tax=Paenibacillus sp. FSL R7-0345 TaxID=2954535 RepID=UPI003159E559
MKEYELLRIQLLKTLVQMEEKLIGVEKKKLQFYDTVESRDENLIFRQNSPQQQAIMSVSELSEYLGVSTDCIYTMVRENQIPFIRVRRRILFARESINEWIHINTPYSE